MTSDWRRDMHNIAFVYGVEGGAVYVAERKGAYVVIVDEQDLAELAGETGPLQSFYQFKTPAERDVYLTKRGWLRRAPSTADEEAVLAGIAKSRGWAWTEANRELILAQARAVGDL